MICMRRKMITVVMICTIVLQCGVSFADDVWKNVETGLQMATFSVTPSEGAEETNQQENPLTILRIDPNQFEFVALSTTEDGRILTPAQWAAIYKLTAVINASMYLPDQRTSTGYLRNGSHLNNDYINKRFGSFFVAYPVLPDSAPAPTSATDNNATQTAAENATLSTVVNATHTLPAVFPDVSILDKQADDWENMIGRYKIVIQNFRMINASRIPLWTDEGAAFSIAAVAMDTSGNILFIHCRTPLTVRQLTEILLALPLDISRSMYVEGGPQASLHIRSGDMRQTWSGKYSGDFWSGAHMEWQIPNILGIRRK